MRMIEREEGVPWIYTSIPCRTSVQEFMRQRDHMGLFSEWEGNLLSSQRDGVGRGG